MRASGLTPVLVFLSLAASAAVIQTTGAGSAVTTVTGSADFESTASLYDNPYAEGGMLFSRTGLTFNNNSCGFAGCSGHSGFVGFTGNYMYGTGAGGYFTLAAGSGTTFYGLEFVVGTGFSQSTASVVWQAYSGAVLVGSGSLVLPVGTVIGFSDPAGFDSLRYTDDGLQSTSAPAFDTVRGQFEESAVPEPATFLLAAGGLFGLAFLRRSTRS